MDVDKSFELQFQTNLQEKDEFLNIILLDRV